MNLTLLFDLDDTLLHNSMTDFVPAYLHAVSSHLASYAEPTRIVEAMLAGTQKMIENRSPECTLEDIFYSVFYPMLGLEAGSLAETIEQFYQHTFPQLKSLTQPRPTAIQIVEEAFARGYQVAIATNPLFPQSAVRQRLDWAGLSPDRYPFALIPSIETHHYAKPDPACLAEILAQIGWPEQPVVMVGDDLKNDIRAARELGIPSYWVTSESAQSPNENEKPTASGNLEGFFEWLDHLSPDALQPNYSLPSALLAILRATPAALQSITRGLSPSAWKSRPQVDEWSLTEISCHLRDVDTEVNLPRLQKVIEEANPFLPGVDTDRWAGERGYFHQDGQTALRQFVRARCKILERLDNLRPNDWQRPARHAILGPTNLQELIRIIATHDQLHVRQVYATLQLSRRAPDHAG